MDIQYLLELLLGGIVKGSIYALIALGYTMVYGIIQLINFAHGEIYMIGAFVAFIVAGVMTYSGYTGLSVLLLAAVIAVIYSAAYGFTLEKIAYRPLRNAPRLSPLISAIGASIFLMNYVQLVQTPDFLPFPELIPEFEFMGEFSSILSSADLVILIVTTFTMIALTVLIRFTKIGKAMRATQQDQIMARLVGINVDRVISWTFIIGSILAAIAGVLIGSRTGQINTVIGFMAGELGELPGGWPEPFRSKVLKGRTVKIGVEPLGADDVTALEGDSASRRSALNRLLFAAPTKIFEASREQYGDLSVLDTVDYLYGLQQGVEHVVHIGTGVSLFVGLEAIGEADDKGMRTVMSTLNGQLRPVFVRDNSITVDTKSAEKADATKPGHVAAPFSGVVTLQVAEGDTVEVGQSVASIEAMKMEAAITSPVAGVVKRAAIGHAQAVEGGDLLVEIA